MFLNEASAGTEDDVVGVFDFMSIRIHVCVYVYYCGVQCAFDMENGNCNSRERYIGILNKTVTVPPHEIHWKLKIENSHYLKQISNKIGLCVLKQTKLHIVYVEHRSH